MEEKVISHAFSFCSLPLGVPRAPPSSGAPPASAAQVPCGQTTYGQFGQGDIQNGPSSTAQMQRYVLGEPEINVMKVG
jgi:protein transport protein SEC24